MKKTIWLALTLALLSLPLAGLAESISVYQLGRLHRAPGPGDF